MSVLTTQLHARYFKITAKLSYYEITTVLVSCPILTNSWVVFSLINLSTMTSILDINSYAVAIPTYKL
jgi:hypothetical protein